MDSTGERQDSTALSHQRRHQHTQGDQGSAEHIPGGGLLPQEGKCHQDRQSHAQFVDGRDSRGVVQLKEVSCIPLHENDAPGKEDYDHCAEGDRQVTKAPKKAERTAYPAQFMQS
jgi:hypothetical protein